MLPAWRLFREALVHTRAIESKLFVPLALVRISGLLVKSGQLGQAAELLGLAWHQPQTVIDIGKDAQGVLSKLRQALSPEKLEAAMASGAAMDLDSVLQELIAGQWMSSTNRQAIN
jgi:hypothetical protein